MKSFFKKTLGFIFLLLLLISIIGITNTKNIKQGSLAFSNKWQGKFMNIDDEKIRYIDKGKGKILLLIHGTPGSIEDWNSIIDSLSISNRVIAYDRLGNGFSTANTYNYTLSENVKLANKIIKKLNLNDVIVVGHSYGGSIATKLATEKNDKIKSFVVIASPLYQFHVKPIYKILSAPVLGKGIAVIGSKFTAKDMIKNGLLNTFGKDSILITPSYLDIRNKLWAQPKVLYATGNVRSNYDNDLKSSSVNYKNIIKKISFLVGTDDDLYIVEDMNKIAKEIKHSKFYVYKDISHYIQFSKPKEVLQIIKEHLITE